MNLLLVTSGLAFSVLWAARLLHTGSRRLLPVAALAAAGFALATPPGRALSARVGDALVVVVQLLAWVGAPLVVAGLLVWATAGLARQPGRPGSPARLATLTLTMTLGLLVWLLLARLADVAGSVVDAAAEGAAGYVVSAASAVLTPDP